MVASIVTLKWFVYICHLFAYIYSPVIFCFLISQECGKDCPLGKLCGNKRFQNVENAPTEVFKTTNKGVGLRATQEIPG